MDTSTFREPTPAEIQQAVLQFMGQNIGELKELDANLISKTNTLNGMTLQPKQILDSVPRYNNAPVHQQQPISQPVHAPQPVHVPQPVQALTSPQPLIVDANNQQLEFNFNPDHYKEIINSLGRQGREIDRISNILNDIRESIVTPFKKKD